MLLTLLVWNIRYSAIYSLAVGSDLNHKLQLWDASLITCGEVPTEMIVFLCVSSEVGFLPTILSEAWAPWEGLFISKSQQPSCKAIHHWIYCLLQKMVLRFFTWILYRWETSAYPFENLKEWQKWIHHLYNKKPQAHTIQAHIQRLWQKEFWHVAHPRLLTVPFSGLFGHPRLCTLVVPQAVYCLSVVQAALHTEAKSIARK